MAAIPGVTEGQRSGSSPVVPLAGFDPQQPSAARPGAALVPTRRDGGFMALRHYAAIGDGRSVALVGSDGCIDWLALPTMDAPPLFAALLDPADGGQVRLAPSQVTHVERRYVEATNVLQTTFHTPTGVVRVTDGLNVGDSGRLPWSELARRVEGLSGEVEMRWEVAPGRRLGRDQPWATTRGGAVLLQVDDQTLALVAGGIGEPRCDGRRVTGTFVARTGSDHLLGLTSVDGEPVTVPDPADIAGRLRGTVESWQRWCGQIGYRGRWREPVLRSALVLKSLIDARSGAIVAAPTTSLPEAIGGDRNFDYRFAWIRDMSFVIEALDRLALVEETHGCLSWLLATVRATAPDLHVFYALDSSVPHGEQQLPVPGYRHSRPVRAGNGAATQTQLGTFGDLLGATWRYVQRGNVLDDRTAALAALCADRVCDLWRSADAGLWELPDRHHYTSSKIGCWAALDRVCMLVDAGQLQPTHLDRWTMERDAIVDWVRTNCWSERKQAYTMHEHTDHLDAAVLLAARTGFDRGERLASTVDAVRAELARGPLLYRYSGMADREGAFLVCSFWLVEALAHTGRVQEASALLDELVVLANDVGLFSEEMDPHSGELLGNFPMGLPHLGLVNAAIAVEELAGR